MASRPEYLPAHPLTYEDYCALPEDGNRWEILDGEIFVSPAPRPRHQRVLGNLFLLLSDHVRSREAGEIILSPIDLILALATPANPGSRTTIAQPDLVFIAAGREAIVTERAIESPPDLAVEILSPSTRATDQTTKAALYARFGVPVYWILDPDGRAFEAWRLREGRYELAAGARDGESVSAPPFPDLRIDLGQVWA